MFNNPFVKFICYANYFIALCTVALCVETVSQHNLPLNNYWLYILLFFVTAAFYSSIYIRNINKQVNDERLNWYRSHKYIIGLQVFNVLAALVSGLLFLNSISHFNFSALFHYDVIILTVVTALAFMYAFNIIPVYKNLRSIGFIKPFILGFVWAGVVTFFPVIALHIEGKINAGIFETVSFWLWLKNFMFISVLCIIFDLKDIDVDKRTYVKTYSVVIGLSKTINYIIIPLIVAGIISFIIFVVNNHFPKERILFNAIPYVLLLIATIALHKNRPLLYYLFVIDGLMLVKGICGILGTQLIK